jgi:ParB family chromosome partitioning protein
MKKNLLQNITEDFTPRSLPDEDPTTPATKPILNARQIPITAIIPDPNQPRKTFNPQTIRELAESIRTKGIIEPLTVRQHEGENKYLIVTGERRFRAAQQAELTHLPCIIRNLNDQEALILQIIENVQREDLKPVDEAKSYKRLMDMGWTQTSISEQTGKSQPYISRITQILNLPTNILDEAEKTDIQKEYLLQLTKTKNPETTWQEIKQGKTAKQIKAETEKRKPLRGRPKNFSRTIQPEGKTYKIIIQFSKPHAETDEIRQALQAALESL